MSTAPSTHLPTTAQPATAGAPVLGHRFADELPEMATPWQAEAAPDPHLLVLDEGLAGELGLDPAWLRSDEGVRLLVGEHVPDGARPVAQVYAGHQFGSWNPRLGDGRALLLGELTGPDGSLRDLHLKGSGRTPYARAGDGLAAVGPMLREHVVSRAMHALGIPTTRALGVVATGRGVRREQVLPGAVLARVASSHLRVGSVQYARATGDPGLLRRLADHAVSRHQPDAAALEGPDRSLALLDGVVARQAELVARWMLVGFVHGVMNTDNTTISGETIDYGPCAFIDAYDPQASFSSIDTGARYAYGHQPGIAEWNLARLAEALLPLLDEDTDRAVELATASLGGFRTRYGRAWTDGMHAKLGFGGARADVAAEGGGTLVEDLLALLQADRVDHTSFYRALAGAARSEEQGGQRGGQRGGTAVQEAFTTPAVRAGYEAWERRWLALHPDPVLMDATNPLYVPRNHLVEEALDAATAGDLGPLTQLVDAVSHPFEERPGLQRYAEPAPEGSGPHVTYCGT